MAQPTIYADIDCNGQVEVKVNNDTGFACTIITSAGANDSVSSTGTDVYKYYNLTNSDWVKVVAAQDVTIAANKLTGTIKFGTFTTTSTTTAAPTTTTTAAPTTTTTTTTPAGGTPISGGIDCDNPQPWGSYGTQYKVTGSAGGEWFEVPAGFSSKTITIVGGDNIGVEYWTYDACTTLMAPTGQTYGSGVLLSSLGTGSTTFRFHILDSGTWDVTIS